AEVALDAEDMAVSMVAAAGLFGAPTVRAKSTKGTTRVAAGEISPVTKQLGTVARHSNGMCRLVSRLRRRKEWRWEFRTRFTLKHRIRLRPRNLDSRFASGAN